MTRHTRVFFDASLLGAARELATRWPFIVHPGHPDWPLKQDAADAEWLELIGTLGWVAVMRDKRIRYRPGERAALTSHRVRVVNLTTKRNLGIQEQLQVIEPKIIAIRSLGDEAAAYYHLTLGGLELKLRYE